ncbi:hypothetical protein RVR_4637 [Actinacidiphila reveromycinica]|uniref:DUF4232 domain-containing protein n=1 Tax=Actinacidiphila reveromycinica TaxID=659352 RepID=A0A7U3VPB9_9ACTN|nr:hypothetical protein [Streptomyces sp. SN-593]BBA98449.1 hypothetical protein RVR_4637 [Streptomyces sp. SN-593]
MTPRHESREPGDAREPRVLGEPRDLKGPIGSGGCGDSGDSGGPSGTHGPEGPDDDAPEMDEQTPRDPHDAQPDEAMPSGLRPGKARPDEAQSAEAQSDGARPDEARPDEATAREESTAPKSEQPAPARALSATPATPAAPAAPAAPATHDVTPDGAVTDLDDLTSDEAALRALMHQAVDGLHASPDALEHLRRAVPLRRQRRRQAMLGAAAAVLLVCVSVPAVLRVADRTHHTAAAPVGVGSSYTVVPGTGGHHKGGSVNPSGSVTHAPGSSPTPSDEPTGPSSPPSTTGSTVPDCSSSQLGQGASAADSPDADGRVYGWFRVSNVSATSCTVPSAGVVRAVAHGSAEQAAIQVVSHTQGDPASGLPAAMSGTPIVLGPGQDYEVAFAWVPTGSAAGCVATSTPPTSSTPTPTTTSTQGSDQGTGTGSSSGSALPADGVPPTSSPPSVTLDHTPAAGAPLVVGPVIQGACAGTVYTTPPIAEPSGGVVP